MAVTPEHARRKQLIAERRQARSEQPQVPSWPEALRALCEGLDEELAARDERLDALEQHAAKCACGHALVRPSWWRRVLSWFGLDT